MKRRIWQIPLGAALILLVGAWPAVAAVRVQCPATILDNVTGQTTNPNVVCKHLIAGDGFINMADKSLLPAGRSQYIFGFADATGQPEEQVMTIGMLGAGFSGPTLYVKQGQDLYLTLTNVGMIMRPDLFDPHSVHYHGFPNAAPIFDGVPDSSVVAIPGASFTYYYKNVDAGTFLYHCHVEATEHMQMGMLGNLYVRPAQDDNAALLALGAARPIGTPFAGFAYDDGDGSTGYDVDFPIQVVAFDSLFHELHIGVQPLPFAAMDDNYPMFNGRGYPDTTIPGSLPPPVDNDNAAIGVGPSQNTSSLIQATAGQKILLRMSSLSTTSFHTIESPGIPMTVVGRDARIFRGGGVPSGLRRDYSTNSVTLGGGESIDVILDTTGIQPGTYFMFARELDHLNNNQERRGGMMTEIRVTP
ncbi:MAG: multicopper oxidase domain-containing protein [Candidatus Deferrimicrobiaceae bacterium]